MTAQQSPVVSEVERAVTERTTEELARILAHDRRFAAERGRRAINEMRRQLDRMEQTFDAAEAGDPIIADCLTPGHQVLNELQEIGAEYRALWHASGYLER